MKKFRLLTYVLLFAGLTFTGCQNNPTNSFNEEDLNTSTPLSSKALGPDVMSETTSNTQQLVILDGGAYHQAAFFPSDGNFIAWGDDHSEGTNNRYGEGDDYLENNSDVVAFANGAYTNCVLTSDGNTTCKGYLADDLSYTGGDAVQFDVGYGQSCVLTEDGNVNCYGSYLGASNSWKSIYSGGDAEWVINSDYAACYKTAGTETLTCQGWNVSERQWDVEGTPTPNAEGHYAPCVLTEEGDIDCMNNTYNEVGQTEGYYGGDAIAFDSDTGQTCYVKENGDIVCFGRNGYDGTMSISGKNAVDVSLSGSGDICYATADGDINCTRSTPDEYETGPSDSEAPEISFSNVTTNLWPPNHKMQMVGQVTATDESNITAFDVTVSSIESSNGKGDGNTENDYEVRPNGMGGYDIYVRAERSGKGEGRTYIITANAEDEFGNSASDSFEVTVAKSQTRGRR